MKTHFVVDGYENALRGLDEYLSKRRVEIEARVAGSYRSRFQNAGYLRQALLRMRMNKEIEEEMKREKEKLTPPSPDALY